jgi:uncharacterized SAM-binding protein YcdF (DUF218 family)
MDWLLFVAKKCVSALLYPLGLTLALWAVGIMLWIRNRGSRTGFVLILSGGTILLAASSPFVSNTLMKPLELKAGPYADPAALQQKGVHFIVVLGGDLRAGDLTPADRVAYSSLVRCMEALRLWKRLSGSKLILSGGSVSSKKMATAAGMALLAQDLGVPQQDIILETQSWDTADEAEFLKPVLGTRPFALVTSACHMARAMMIFERAGLHPIPAPADFQDQDTSWGYSALLPGVYSLLDSQRAIHEYLGIALMLLKDSVIGRSPQEN